MDSELHALLGIDEYVVASYRVNAQVLINGGAEGISTWYLPRVLVDFEATPGRMRHRYASDYDLGILHGECFSICGSGPNLLSVVAKPYTL